MLDDNTCMSSKDCYIVTKGDVGPFTLCMLSSFFNILLLSSSDFFSKQTFSFKKSFRDTIRVSKGLYSDKDRHYIGPDLGLIWVQTVCKGYQQTTIVVNRKR